MCQDVSYRIPESRNLGISAYIMSSISEQASRLREEVAKAIYDVQVRAAVTEVDNSTFEVHDFPKIFEKLKAETETGQTLIFGSLLEDKFLTLMKSRMRHLTSRGAEESLFGGNGPLAAMSARSALAYQLGWLTKEQYDKLSAFRKIRNEFAHRAFKVSFSDQSIRSLLAVIEYDLSSQFKRANEVFGQMGIEGFAEISSLPRETLNLCQLAVLAIRTFEDMLVLPTAIGHRVQPNSVLKSSKKTLELRKDLVSTFVVLAGSRQLRDKFHDE